jgi:hypothetical protein
MRPCFRSSVHVNHLLPLLVLILSSFIPLLKGVFIYLVVVQNNRGLLFHV